ncbi:MAG: dipeptide epimerase [Burkholderiales bacterium]|nr:dipeptide epimerase [Burkholderiales bacterium]
MKITKIEIAKLRIPLIRPFITALRRTEHVEDIVVTILTDEGSIGYGAAASTPVITGDSQESIIGAIQIIGNKLLGLDIASFESILLMIQNSVINNSSAKAALDMAIHDLVAKKLQTPLYKMLGGGNSEIKTLTTVSVKDVNDMVEDARLFISQGFETLKIKVGQNPLEDIERLKKIREAVGNKINIVSDANQGWDSKSALQIIDTLVNSNVGIAMVEQPCKAWDLENLKYIRDNSPLPIFADESAFNIRDVTNILANRIADGINIKLMKSGGIYQARTIYDLSTAHNIPCMAGCMLESPIGLAAMASFVVSRHNIQFVDLDSITMIKANPVHGGVQLKGATLLLSDEAGLGIKHIDDLEIVSMLGI